MRTTIHGVVALGALLLSGCAVGPEIRTDHDAAADFARFSTFAFMERRERGEEQPYQTLTERRVIAAVTREMEARGYRRVDQGADLLVNFAMTSEHVQDLRAVPTHSPMWVHPWYGHPWHGHPWGWRSPFYGPWPAYEPVVVQYERGSLFIDLVDVERRQLVWEGRAVQRVTRAAREDPSGAIDAAVGEMFARFPFRAGAAR